MIDIENIQKVYFIGIGGIGMSAIARYFKSRGKHVSGYDKTETVLTKALNGEGIEIHYDDNISKAPKDADIIVYTPAIPKNHSELKYYQEHSYPILKRSDVLGIITKGSYNICVAGTHGKTTISSMVAHLLRDSGYGCNAFLGGISGNYNSNYWSHERNVCVVEADEYDRSFLKLHPDIAVISAMDPDHLDIYGTADSMHEAFIDFSAQLKPRGLLVSRYGLEKAATLKATAQKTYGLEIDPADVRALNIKMSDGTYQFDVQCGSWLLRDINLNMGGMHNVENITVSIFIAHLLEIEDEKIKTAVNNYKGVRRRFEYVLKEDNGVVFIDDYAHHPEELRALINGARNLFPSREMIVIFQPHLFTRTRDFVEGFAEVLDMADEVALLPIYPARELPIEGVSSEIILERMKLSQKNIIQKEEVVEFVSGKTNSDKRRKLIITAGAGDIDTLVLPIKNLFINEVQE